MLNCKYSRKVWKYLRQSELQIYFLVFIHWFLDLNFENFPCSAIFGLDLGYFQIFFWYFTTRHLYFETLNFFTQVLLELDFENCLKVFFKPCWLYLDFEKILKIFQPCVIEVELLKFVKFFQTCTDCDWTLKFFWTELNMCTHMIELVYNCWTTCHWLTQLYCTWLMLPLHKFRHSIKIFFKIFYHIVTW